MSVVELFPSREAAFIEGIATSRRHLNHYEVIVVFTDGSRELFWRGPWRDECNRQIRCAMERYRTDQTRIVREGVEDAD
jgi:hypothetical protein